MTLGALALLLAFSGCEAMRESRREKQMTSLRSAGFVSVPLAQLSSDRRFANLTPYTMQEVTVRSGTVTCFYDPENRRVLVGGPREAAAYEKLKTAKGSQLMN